MFQNTIKNFIFDIKKILYYCYEIDNDLNHTYDCLCMNIIRK